MRRVIIKSYLANHFDFFERLGDIGLEFDSPYWQHDRIYLPRGYQPSSNYPRLALRTEVHSVDQPAEYKLILHRHIEDSGLDLVDITPILDYSATASILAQLGFSEKAELSRQRRELLMGDKVRLYLDQVEGIPGSEFIKIESDLSDSDKISSVREDLQATLITLGQKPEDFIFSPYHELL